MYASFDIFICKPYSCDFTTAHLECDVNFSLFKFLVPFDTVCGLIVLFDTIHKSYCTIYLTFSFFFFFSTIFLTKSFQF